MSERVVVRCGRLIDGTGAAPRSGVTLTIEDGRIRHVAPSMPDDAPAGAGLIDAGDRTVMPGLMDIHVHLIHGVTDPRDPHILYGLMHSSTQMLTLWAARNARLMLEGGFTCLRDVSSFINPANPEARALRDAVALNLVPGPRVVAGGWVSQTAGHRDMFPTRDFPRDPEMMADSPWEVRRVVRRMVREGVDFIKTSTSGGAGAHGEEIWWRNWTDEELDALVDEAHAVGKRVASHSHSAESVKRAVRAGVDTIEHGIYIDDEAIAMMAERGSYLVPTLSARAERAIAHRRASGSPADVMRKFEHAQAHGLEGFAKAYKAGVRIAMGTDTGRGLRAYFGKNAYELTQMVQAGMPPMAAIVASTATAAAALGQEADLGTLEAGKLADLLIVDGDPLSDIAILEDAARIEAVIIGGRVVVARGRYAPHLADTATVTQRAH
jgi:imidazolonepropionase-like amidohydrolase